MKKFFSCNLCFYLCNLLFRFSNSRNATLSMGGAFVAIGEDATQYWNQRVWVSDAI